MLPYRFQTRSNLIAAKCCALDRDGNYKLRGNQRNQGRWRETRRKTATDCLLPWLSVVLCASSGWLARQTMM